MTRKVGIIGLGHVGATVAHGLIAQGAFDDYVLIDTNEAKVAAEAMDFADAAANLGHHANIIINDYQSLADADVVISALGNITLQDNPHADRFAELPFTAKEVPVVAQQLKAVGFKGVLVVISNPVDVVTSLYQKYTGLPKDSVIGTGTLLDTARMKRTIAQQFTIDARSVQGYNLGEHGNSQFTAWSQVKVKGQAISDFLSTAELERLEKAAMMGGHTVFYAKKYTSYGIASATIRLVLAIVSDAREELPVSHYYEPLGTYLSYPAIVGRAGIVERVQLNLTDDEEKKLIASARFIQEKCRTCICK
ncbi:MULTISPECIES: L-lactate dehydrogenase [unclassified Streptococcus]|uniref:L-lactate dehydrogenase n=1 Tax=unclassified Streptococcus TaxID=2608887 RepID=UPI001071C11D|nr:MULTISPECIES: L-lactate dehydrogenase [unclassified Streptococcus]MBF0786899.1 L-lactate dehydrogenase [Streptococcus sp. 19428wC2_LYSM12]MCQ9212689.1 L-lactate dehydrogenase [Streptococcus sp. B01]MCQ9214030.1 L-lactate dehydrogenase [Streptococcus sp. O1]TFV06267.1 L-lactate dehydrogenase [Streptococcus sp. LYSM12]